VGLEKAKPGSEHENPINGKLQKMTTGGLKSSTFVFVPRA